MSVSVCKINQLQLRRPFLDMLLKTWPWAHLGPRSFALGLPQMIKLVGTLTSKQNPEVFSFIYTPQRFFSDSKDYRRQCPNLYKPRDWTGSMILRLWWTVVNPSSVNRWRSNDLTFSPFSPTKTTFLGHLKNLLVKGHQTLPTLPLSALEAQLEFHSISWMAQR